MNPPSYDIIIVGGGIAGLYTAFSLLSKAKHPLQLLLLEKESYLGGRVFTFHDAHMKVEAGAGRFHCSHPLLFDLMEILDLTPKIQPIISHPTYIDCTNQRQYPESMLNSLVERLIHASPSFDTLHEISLLEFAKQILSQEEIQFFQNSFGFSTELHFMNAYDAIILLKTLFRDCSTSTKKKNHGFYYLVGGLSQIIERLTQRIISMGGHIFNHATVTNVTVIAPKTYEIHVQNGNAKKEKYVTNQCIFAIPKQNLQRIPIFHSLRPSHLDKIYCGSLCRIYTKFANGAWFSSLSRFTTQNDLRMVIPLNPKEGTMMISYSDGPYADRWNRIYKKHGMHVLKRRLRELLSECLSMYIPPLGPTRIFYWECGVGYWSVGANSRLISQQMITPFRNENIYVCREHYSDGHQQWMEGALETSSRVVKQLWKR